MHTKSHFNVEQLIHLIRHVVSGIPMFKVFAEEVVNPSPSPNAGSTQPAQQQLNYEDLIANARKEEKDKLYPKIKKAEADLKEQVKLNNELLIKNATLQKELDALKSASGTPDPRIEELETENKNLKKRISELEANTPNEEDIRKKVEAEYEVKFYVEQKKAELQKDGSVLPSFLDSITGATKDEVDAAVTKAVSSTLQIKKDLGLVDDKGNPISNRQPSVSTSTTTTPTNPTAPSVNPTDNGGIESYSAEYIRGLDPSSKEYQEFRKKLGFK